MRNAIADWMWLACAGLVGLGAAEPKVPQCPELTDAHEQAMAEVVLQLAEGRISEGDALERMKEIIPAQCHPTMVDRQPTEGGGDGR
jgi:hypothetical protein